MTNPLLPSQAPVPEPSVPEPAPPGPDPKAGTVLVPLVVGCLVALVLGVYGRVHEPTGFSINLSGFSGGTYVKSWLVTMAALLAVVQLASAKLMYGGSAANWVPGLHRWSGRIAVLLTVPVVVHCLYALGFQANTPRVLIHSLLGCVFYGAFVAKMMVLTRRGMPGWVLPAVGGVTFSALIGLWLTSALWVFGTTGLHL